jgi:hypothetical protein
VDGPLHHWLLEKLSRELAEEYERIQLELKGNPKNIQLSGHLAEAVWARLLAEWFPPQYKFGFRRYLLFERPVDGETRSREIDLVLFHPSYPERLRDEKEVLISGVIAAFSVKLTLTPGLLSEGIGMAAQLRRGMVPRIREPIGDLVSPLITGVLAQSHRDMGNVPAETVLKTLLAAARQLDGTGASDDGGIATSGLATHPRNELDFVCVADLNCWHRQPVVMWQGSGVPFAQDEDKYIAYWTSWKPLGPPGDRSVEPIAILVAELWQKLAHRDSALKAVADGFRMTNTSGTGAGSGEPKSLSPLVDPETYQTLRTRGSFQID